MENETFGNLAGIVASSDMNQIDSDIQANIELQRNLSISPSQQHPE